MTRILSHPDPGTRKTLIQKNRDDFSALDYSGVANNPRIACFLAELFYILGEDVTSPDKGGNTLLHLMAAMGDQCAPTLEVIIRHPRVLRIFQNLTFLLLAILARELEHGKLVHFFPNTP